VCLIIYIFLKSWYLKIFISSAIIKNIIRNNTFWYIKLRWDTVYNSKANTALPAKMYKWYICLPYNHGLTASQGLRNVIRANTHEFKNLDCIATGVLCLQRCTRFERWSHLIHKYSHSRINNARRRTKILLPMVFSRASVQKKRSHDYPRKLGLVRCAHGRNIRWSRRIQNDQHDHDQYHCQCRIVTVRDKVVCLPTT